MEILTRSCFSPSGEGTGRGDNLGLSEREIPNSFLFEFFIEGGEKGETRKGDWDFNENKKGGEK